MGFKEQAEMDLKRTFLNDLEFAEERQVDGEPMRVVVDDHSLVERGGAEHTDGIYSAQLLVYVSAAEYGARPKRNKLLNLDGRDYRIAKVEEDMGLYTFTLEANRA
jgi:hypothetical protein